MPPERVAPRFALLGHPVAHSASPAMHAAALAAMPLDASYEAIDCPDEASFALQISRLRGGELDGVNVTLPYKRLACALADRVDPSAARVGAANTLVRAPACAGAPAPLVAHNTDVPALVDELAALGASPGVALVLGAGGAALAAVEACRLAGATDVLVSTRSWSSPPAGEPVDPARWPGAEPLVRLGARPVAWPTPLAPVASSITMVVQATSAALRGGIDAAAAVAARVPWHALPPHAVAIDLVYTHGARTSPFELAAAAVGLAARDGLGMLARQGARALALWVGREPDLDVMLRAARRHVEGAR